MKTTTARKQAPGPKQLAGIKLLARNLQDGMMGWPDLASAVKCSREKLFSRFALSNVRRNNKALHTRNLTGLLHQRVLCEKMNQPLPGTFRIVFLVFTILSLTLSTPTYADPSITVDSIAKDPSYLRALSYVTPLKEQILGHWELSTDHLPRKVRIELSIAMDGKFHEIRIIRSSGVSQLDAECLEAVCDQSPFKPHSYEDVGSRIGYTMEFLETDRPIRIANEIRDLVKRKKNKKALIVHRIPLSTATRYPGLLLAKDISSPDNLREANNFNSVIKEYSLWADFFASHSTATKEQVLTIRHIADRV